jgi:hypothetical protein
LLTSQSADGQGMKLYLAGEDAHKRFNCQQWGCVVAQVGAGIHDGVDLFDGGLWLGFFSQGADLGFKLFVD